MENERMHFRHVIYYEFKKGSSVGTAAKNIQEVYKESAPNLRTVKKWFSRFRNGECESIDRPRSGRPSGIDDEVIREFVENNPTVTTEEIAERLNIDHSTAFRHLKKLGFK